MLQTWYFLAMAHQRLGHRAEARRWFDTASRAMEKVLKRPAETPGSAKPSSGKQPTPHWNQKLTLELLRHEAEELIGPK
jgi:hypothetical protein